MELHVLQIVLRNSPRGFTLKKRKSGNFSQSASDGRSLVTFDVVFRCYKQKLFCQEENPPSKKSENPLEISRWLKGSVRDPYVIVWAGIAPNRKRLIIRRCLGPSGWIWGFTTFGGSDRKLVFRC